MKNYFKLLILTLSFMTIQSCHKKIQSEKGGIDLVSNVYFNASKGLDKMQSFHLSKLNYFQNQMVEIIPDLEVQEFNRKVYYIKDSLCFPLENTEGSNIIFSELNKQQKAVLVLNKKEGAIFSKEHIPNYKNRRKLPDTLLFNKNYKRFEINSPWTYSRFYIYPTDTIMPYSLYRHAEQDYGGRLERIDYYNKKTDVFVSLQLLPRKNWDAAAKELFDYNQYIKNRHRE